MSSLVPFDTVETVTAQVIAAGEIGRFTLLEVFRDADRQIGEAVNDWKREQYGEVQDVTKWLKAIKFDTVLIVKYDPLKK